MPTFQQIMLAAVTPGTPPVTPPTWQNVTGATDSSGLLTKTAGDGWGNCGAASNQTVAANARLVIYDVDLTKNYVVGVGTTTSCNTFSTPNACIHCNGSSDLNIYESGTLRATVSGLTNKWMIVIERTSTNQFDYYYLNYTGANPSPTDPSRTHWRGPITLTSSALFVNVAMFFNANSVLNAANLGFDAI